MSIFYYLRLKEWDSYLESLIEVYGDIDEIDMDKLATDAYLITNLSILKKFHPDNSFKEFFEGDYSRFYEDVESVIADELSTVKKGIGISERFDMFLTAFYDFRFRIYRNHFDGDIDECINRCFDASIDCKNWTIVTDDASIAEKKTALMRNCYDEIVKYFKRDFNNYEPDTI